MKSWVSIFQVLFIPRKDIKLPWGRKELRNLTPSFFFTITFSSQPQIKGNLVPFLREKLTPLLLKIEGDLES